MCSILRENAASAYHQQLRGTSTGDTYRFVLAENDEGMVSLVGGGEIDFLKF
eukprot:UN08624